MANKITWDEAQNRVYEYGVSKGVHYMLDDKGAYSKAAPWNGLINVTDSPEGADNTKLWADGIEYAAMRAAEEYGASVEAYTYPDQFAECDGSVQPIPGMYVTQQPRKTFGMCWRTEIGNADNHEAGYKLHLAYGLTASPTEKSHDTVNDSPDAETLSWDMEGVPVPFTGHKPTAKIEIDSTKIGTEKMAALEAVLYGGGDSDARLPLPDELLSILKAETTPEISE